MEPTKSVVETDSESGSAAESGAVGTADHHETGTGGVGISEVPGYVGIDPALQLLAEVWSELPDSVKNRILRLADDALCVPGDSH